LEDTITCMEHILDGSLDHIQEHHFMYKWTLADVKASYEKEQAAG
jgi:F0F1-type ATP synthase beta subunit